MKKKFTGEVIVVQGEINDVAPAGSQFEHSGEVLVGALCMKGNSHSQKKHECQGPHKIITQRKFLEYLNLCRIANYGRKKATIATITAYTSKARTVRLRIAPSIFPRASTEDTATILLMHTILPMAPPTD